MVTGPDPRFPVTGVHCPACNVINVKEARWFQSNPDTLLCSGCGKTVPLDSPEYETGAGAIETHRRQMEELREVMDLANKRLRRGR